MIDTNVPKLRFSEFDGEIEIETLESKIDLVSGITFKGDDLKEEVKGTPILRGINITEGMVRHNPDIDRFFIGDITKFEKFKLRIGDLVLGMDGSKVGKNVALITKRDVGALLIQRVARIRAKESSDINFIYQNIFSYRFHRYVDVVNTSSGIPHISSKQIKEFRLSFPTLPEQQKIASFLTTVDTKIEQLTKKKSLLEQYKKGVMQGIFCLNHDGPDLLDDHDQNKSSQSRKSQKSRCRQLRFQDKNGKDYPDWEEKKLGEVCEVNPKSPELPQKFIYVDLESVIDKKLIKEFELESLDAPSRAQRVLSRDDILYQTVRPYQMNNLHFNRFGNYVASTGYAQLRAQQSSGFIFQIIHTKEFVDNVLERCTGTSYPAISSKDLGKIKINFPCLQEQTQIANLLTTIDTKISLVNTQLENTQQFKKGLLQQMFV